MPRLLLRLALVFCLILGASHAAPAPAGDDALIRRVADGILRDTTRRLVDRATGETFTASADLPLKASVSIESKFNAWFYQTWLLTDGMRRLATRLGDPAYTDYGERNLEFIYRHLPYFERQHAAGLKAAPVGDGALSPIAFHFRLTDLWHTGLAPLVVERSAATRDPRYTPYLERIAAYLAQAARLPDGTLHRARSRLMGDDPYMSVPYFVRLHRATGEASHLDAAVQQVLGSHRVLRDAASGLYRHGWDVKTQQPLGHLWGRVNGWMVLAQVELLAALPPTHPRRAEVLAVFAAHAAALRRAQNPAGGWHQLLDDPTTWLETSCTGMFVYGLTRGVNEGWLDASFAADARRGWSALTTKITPEGDIIDVCGSTDIGDTTYYRNRPRLRGDLHGFGPFLLAGAEIVHLTRIASPAR